MGALMAPVYCLISLYSDSTMLYASVASERFSTRSAPGFAAGAAKELMNRAGKARTEKNAVLIFGLSVE